MYLSFQKRYTTNKKIKNGKRKNKRGFNKTIKREKNLTKSHIICIIKDKCSPYKVRQKQRIIKEDKKINKKQKV